MRNESEIKDRIKQHQDNLELWNSGYLNPTEGDLYERASVIRELVAAIEQLQWVLSMDIPSPEEIREHDRDALTRTYNYVIAIKTGIEKFTKTCDQMSSCDRELIYLDDLERVRLIVESWYGDLLRRVNSIESQD